MSAEVKEWDHYVTYTLRSGQQGHIVLRTPAHPSLRLLRGELAKYGLDPADVKDAQWQPVPSVRQSQAFQRIVDPAVDQQMPPLQAIQPQGQPMPMRPAAPAVPVITHRTPPAQSKPTAGLPARLFILIFAVSAMFVAIVLLASVT
ncbi:hypothetical protein [Corynebacterium epidermidicanis]|uniref:Uncharacterized protein n=1 Tax=Corynebacterium epidermidicanis TaxID=1050174 RepID=A0A0G3GPS3_9CORY|nr:hypothetical protein [Corynebacterium epidermidicanis]AKK03191.1 hypothetical protein CEPID_06665 [Corynebacterium epidermidicanis]